MASKIIPPPVYALIILALMFAAHYFFPIARVFPYPYNLLGIILLAIGAVIGFSALFLFFKARTTLDPNTRSKELVTNWPYSFSRNPMYVGAIAIFFGIAILLGSLSTFIFPIIFWLILNFKIIPFEEKQIESAFGKKYLDYKKEVRRWL